MRRFRFTSRQLFAGIAALALALVVGRFLVQSFSPIPWHTFTLAGLESNLDAGRVVLVLYEGHPGGRHQYVVVDEIMEHWTVRRALASNRVIPIRANVMWNPEARKSFEDAGRDRDEVPILAIYDPTDAASPQWINDVSSANKEGVRQAVVGAFD